MDNNKTAEGRVIPAPTGVFDVNTPKKPNPSSNTTGVFPVDGAAPKSVSEKTLRKRLARLAASRPVLVLAILLSVSALLTAFRGYFWPVTAVLTVSRALSAAAVWTVYLTAGKKGGRFLAALPLYATVFSAVVLLFLAVFIFCAMFGKMVLVSGSGAVALVRLAYSAKLWSVVPALVYIVIAYCLYLFARHQRLLCCNIRDGLIYGFPFENGYKGFLRSCIIVAIVLPVLQIMRGFTGSFAEYELLSSGAAALFDKLFLSQLNYWLNLFGVFVHSAALLAAGSIAVKYAAVVKKYKAQKEARREAKRAERMGEKAKETENKMPLPETNSASV